MEVLPSSGAAVSRRQPVVFIVYAGVLQALIVNFLNISMLMQGCSQ